MDHVPAVVSVIVGVLAVVALGAASLAYFRSAYAKATVTTLSESNQAQAEQIRILKDQRAEDEKVQATITTRLASVERENGILREVVQGKADIERVLRALEDQNHAAIQDRDQWRETWAGRMDHQDAALSQIKGMLGSNRQTVRETRQT